VGECVSLLLCLSIVFLPAARFCWLGGGWVGCGWGLRIIGGECGIYYKKWGMGQGREEVFLWDVR